MKEWYPCACVDYVQGVRRFGGKEVLYQQFLIKFLQDDSYQKVCRDLSARDLSMLNIDIVMLQGLAGNLGLTNLQLAAGRMAWAARHCHTCEALQTFMEQTTAAYQEVYRVLVDFRDGRVPSVEGAYA